MLDKITTKDIMNIANKYFNLNSINVLIYGNVKEKTLKHIKNMIGLTN